MLSIPASRPNAYTGSPLDRAALRREDADWIAAALADPETLFVPVWRARSLMKGVQEGRPEAVLLTGAAAEAVRMAGGPWSFLGLWEGRPVFAVDCSEAADPLPLLPEGMGSFTDLRAVAGLLPAGEASVLAHARGLMHWRTKHRFCGICGSGCEPRSAGHAMVCTGCKAQHFPRTDPAVIMLVVRDDHCLLGHSTRFPNTVMYSTLAGFVEPGESLEEAVRREVLEESGIVVGDVRYHSSQPWPFPSSIMLGFHAEGLTEAITIDPEELRDARWFSRAEIRDPAAHGFALPRADSIARRLIEDWLAHGMPQDRTTGA
ncbi:NADH pyrophosphatase [Siccirubricoccus deserti]|uniref:NAD(+) diphosphatase n=1 Tax=Siccirubricoccus deserti TaxID=2013562 RepID=A0A9X0QVZ9_9PROT|nr:NAD(+) diphosphatase [Siccirubricoccus deserti]MBC4014869.1 NAD(+) diphosphatase [Siccirubricoccus deserti]GGC35679.1 NADH pyrophosphatase [Siccirubricoccus deserti]